jgi:hypothetical protein
MTKQLRPHQIVGYENAAPSRNLLINSGFEIWQRGNGPFITPNIYTCDEWKIANYSLGAMSVTRSATPLSGTYCITATTTGASVDIAIEQGIESYKSLQGLWVTLSVSVKTSVANCNRAWISDYDGSTQNTVASPAHTGSGNWERLSCTKLIRPTLQSNPLWPHSFGIDCGVHFSNAATALIDDATLVIGNYPEGVPYIPENPATEFTRCQRFYEVHGGTLGTHPYFAMGGASSYVGIIMQFTTRKYATPTLTKSGNWTTNVTLVYADQCSVDSYRLYGTIPSTANYYVYPTDATGIITAEVP